MVQQDQSTKIRVGISACLLGENVRFDGGHQYSRYCSETLEPYFQYQPVCPEVGSGMSTPREVVRLVNFNEERRMIGYRSGHDYTDAIQAYNERNLPELAQVSGFIFKRKSPSCGMERVKVYQPNKDIPENDGVGLFAKAFMQRYPLVPTEEDGRLNDPLLRENFVQRVFVYDQWQRLQEAGITEQALLDFHSRHKYMLMAHSQAAYRELGRLLGNLKDRALEEIAAEYIHGMMHALRKVASKRSHANVLLHIMGHFKRDLDKASKAELKDTIMKYREGIVPLVVPLALIRHHMMYYGNEYIQKQAYLAPHPEDLKLRVAV